MKSTINLTPDQAIKFVPNDKTYDFDLVSIPTVDCGKGYRQLNFREEIKSSDEWYSGKENGWQKTTCEGSLYIPTHSNAEYAPYALTRRSLNA
jgi:hypothetical protein